ncbi:hypothetical protein OHA40_04515 [Nocardia sp. NBC_00508]|uniref:hypothetical protein n=1 Tax=Nocardia sp. NBC_00508 TaxID=2975992 RepID=UPI002E7FDAE8|nr:hypothetical protein [Nocardia sp. NBC_00508]WUD67413.1 hypothetical protein OHA40_04515 [Nocardia sp. NBC_00508]
MLTNLSGPLSAHHRTPRKTPPTVGTLATMSLRPGSGRTSAARTAPPEKAAAPEVLIYATVMTPSLPTLSIASAASSPMDEAWHALGQADHRRASATTEPVTTTESNQASRR